MEPEAASVSNLQDQAKMVSESWTMPRVFLGPGRPLVLWM